IAAARIAAVAAMGARLRRRIALLLAVVGRLRAVVLRVRVLAIVLRRRAIVAAPAVTAAAVVTTTTTVVAAAAVATTARVVGLAVVLRRRARILVAAVLVLVVLLAAAVAHRLCDAVAVLHDLHAVAELHIAVVALGDGDLLAVVLLNRDLDAAAAAADTGVPVDDGAGDRAADRAQHAADQAAAEAAAARGTDGDAAQAAQQAAHHGAVARAAAASAALQADVVDRHHTAGTDGLAVGRCRCRAVARRRV